MTKLTELKNALVAWRKADKAWIEGSWNPRLRQKQKSKLQLKANATVCDLRRIVDGMTWADIKHEL